MLKMMLPNIIKKEIRKNVFSLPFSWSLQEQLCRGLKDDATTTTSSSCVPPVNETSTSIKGTDSIESNPFYGRYADKIKKAIDSEGIKIADKIEENLKEIVSLNTIPESQRVKSKVKKGDQLKEAGPKIGGFPGNRTLKDLVNLEMLLKLDAEGISQVWSEYHKVKSQCIYAVIPGEKYKIIYETGRKYPTFIFPVPTVEKSNSETTSNNETTKSGYQIFLGQFNYHQIHFTGLISYHLHQENAPAAMTLRHYPEISEEKGIVLMEGYYDDKLLNSMEAQCLANQVQIFYGAKDLTKNVLLHKFNKDPKTFDYNEVIDQFEKGLL